MKYKIYNYDKIDENNIHNRVVRVKAIMLNSKNEILLGESFGTVQFPGGHLEENESLKEGLIREVKEETGILLKEVEEPFFAIKYLLKDYPIIGNNRSVEIYYFLVITDEKYHLDKLYLDDQEKNGEFKLYYLPLKKLKKELTKNIKNQKINKLITKEMLLAIKECKKYIKGGKNGNKKI